MLTSARPSQNAHPLIASCEEAPHSFIQVFSSPTDLFAASTGSAAAASGAEASRPRRASLGAAKQLQMEEEICSVQVSEVDNGFEVYEIVSSPSASLPLQPNSSTSDGVVKRSFSDDPYVTSSRQTDTFLGQHKFELKDSDDDEEGSGELMMAEVKNKIKSLWNNVRYGWTVRLKTNFSVSSAIVLLGRWYFHKDSDRPVPDNNGRLYHPSIEAFSKDFTSRFWFTYRRGFAPIGPAQLTTDCGWGCMIRTGQMLLAQGLLAHFLSRDWSLYQRTTQHSEAFHRQIVRWFADSPTPDAPFSLHHLVEWSRKEAGQWFGPVTIAQAMQGAFRGALTVAPLLNQLRIYVAYDNCIYRQDLLDLAYDNVEHGCAATNGAQTGQPPAVWHSLIVIVPLWLGGAKGFNSMYEPCIKAMLADDSCIGIIGGRPKHSMYFVGWQDDKLIYLDPHYCQEHVITKAKDFQLDSFHCFAPRKMSFSKMDPSCAIGFYLRSRTDLEPWMSRMADLSVPPMQKTVYHMFEFKDGTAREFEETVADMASSSNDQILRVRKFNTTSGQSQTDEFVLL